MSNEDVAKAKQRMRRLRDTYGEGSKNIESDEEGAKSISNQDIEKAKMIIRGEENNSDGDGFRNGGKVSLRNFKGSF